MNKIRYTGNLLLVFLLLLVVAINRDGTILGIKTEQVFQQQEKIEAEILLPNGIREIRSEVLAPKVFGYGGRVPLRVRFEKGKIKSIEIGHNSESEEFMSRVIESGLLEKYLNLTAKDITEKRVEAISGATLTSKAIIENMTAVGAYSTGSSLVQPSKHPLSLKTLLALGVVILGMATSLLKIKNKRLRLVLHLLNLSILGLWCGSFISLTLLINYVTNGIHLTTALIPLLLVAIAIAMPFFGTKNQYCNYHCPMGSAQELLGKNKKWKIKITPKLYKKLVWVREIVFLLLLFVMWIGVGFRLLEYEVFVLFLFRNASDTVVVLGCVFLLLSLFINRPYCNYLCPTGSLLKFTQQTQSNK